MLRRSAQKLRRSAQKNSSANDEEPSKHGALAVVNTLRWLEACHVVNAALTKKWEAFQAETWALSTSMIGP